MKRIFFAAIILFGAIKTNAQTIVQARDKALDGQLKRMVYIKWDDWQPSPSSWKGYFYWRFTWRKYWKGKDRRPYRVGGIFDYDYAQAAWFTDLESKMRDTVQDVAKDEALNYASKSGGTLDYPYNFYYKGIFNDLKKQVPNALNNLLLSNPSVYYKVINDKYYQDYKGEFMDYIDERIETVHESFGEKGDRILSYIDIHRLFEEKNEHIMNIIRLYKKLSPLEASKRATPVKIHEQTDSEIRMRIMSNLSF